MSVHITHISTNMKRQLEDYCETLQNEIDKLRDWSDKWQLYRPDKCKVPMVDPYLLTAVVEIISF